MRYYPWPITEEDMDWDYVKMLPNILPKLRNEFARGSTELNNWALRSIEIVCEIINQLYEAPCSEPRGAR
jgi:hypothetical protein